MKCLRNVHIQKCGNNIALLCRVPNKHLITLSSRISLTCLSSFLLLKNFLYAYTIFDQSHPHISSPAVPLPLPLFPSNFMGSFIKPPESIWCQGPSMGAWVTYLLFSSFLRVTTNWKKKIWYLGYVWRWNLKTYNSRTSKENTKLSVVLSPHCYLTETQCFLVYIHPVSQSYFQSLGQQCKKWAI